MRFLLFLGAVCLAASTVIADEKKVVCYLSSWSVYHPGAGKFEIEDIDTSLCTHAIYAFVGIAGDEVTVLDPWQDLPDNGGKAGFRRFNALRQRNPSLKTLVAIGGWNEGSVDFSAMVTDPNARGRFVRNVVAFVKKHKFDGFDLDWEYPGQRGGAASDVQNYVALVKELREAFDQEGLLLGAAVAAAQPSASQSYNVTEINKYLHLINLMSYDFHASWEKKTGIDAPLYSASSESGDDLELNVDAAVKYWLSQGADPAKIIVGTPFYGKSFTLADPNATQVGDVANGPGIAGPYTREPGTLGYNEICELQNKQNWTIKFDEERRAPYAYSGYQWVGYDNVQSIKEKAEYIKKNGLGGAMVWSIDADDFRGNCGEKYPLIKVLNQVLRN